MSGTTNAGGTSEPTGGGPASSPGAPTDAAPHSGGFAIRTDHVAGLAMLALGAAVLLGSDHLPIGSLRSPGAGFLPRALGGLCVVVGALLLLWSAQSRRLAEVDWHDTPHAFGVMAICIAGSVLLERLGFSATTGLMLFALLRVLDKRPTLFALLYAVAVVGCIYLLLGVVFGAQLPRGSVWTEFL